MNELTEDDLNQLLGRQDGPIFPYPDDNGAYIIHVGSPPPFYRETVGIGQGNIRSRVRQHRSKNGYVQLIAYVLSEEPLTLERALHAKHAKDWLDIPGTRELFALSPGILVTINEARKNIGFQPWNSLAEQPARPRTRLPAIPHEPDRFAKLEPASQYLAKWLLMAHVTRNNLVSEQRQHILEWMAWREPQMGPWTKPDVVKFINIFHLRDKLPWEGKSWIDDANRLWHDPSARRYVIEYDSSYFDHRRPGNWFGHTGSTAFDPVVALDKAQECVAHHRGQLVEPVKRVLFERQFSYRALWPVDACRLLLPRFLQTLDAAQVRWIARRFSEAERPSDGWEVLFEYTAAFIRLPFKE